MEMETWDIIKYINLPLGIISILGCLLIIISFIFFEKIRSFVLELVFYLALSSLMHTLTYIIYIPKNIEDSEKGICQFQAFSMLLFGDAQFIWTTLISYSIYQSVIYLKEISTKNSKCKRFLYILIGFGIPLIISLLGLFLNILGFSGFWCYVKLCDEIKHKIFFVFNFVFIWICILLNFIFYCKVINFIKINFSGSEEDSQDKKYIYSLISYFLIQILCIMPATVNRMYQLFTNERMNFLDYLQSIFDCSQGLAYSIVYGFNPTLRESIKITFKKFFVRDKLTDKLINRKETSDSVKSLKSNINFTRISLIDRSDDILVSD